jgi:hypothetical protein
VVVHSDEVVARRSEHRDPAQQVPAPTIACGRFKQHVAEAVFAAWNYQQKILRRRRVAQQVARRKAHPVATLTAETTKKLDCGVERSRRASERAHLVSHLCDLFQKRLLGALGRVLDRRFNVEDGETRAAMVGFLSEHATHPLDHLAAGTTGTDDHGKVRLRDVDAFVKYPRVARRPAPRMADVVFGDGRDAVWVPQFRIVDRLIAPLQRDVLQRDSA